MPVAAKGVGKKLKLWTVLQNLTGAEGEQESLFLFVWKLRFVAKNAVVTLHEREDGSLYTEIYIIFKIPMGQWQVEALRGIGGCFWVPTRPGYFVHRVVDSYYLNDMAANGAKLLVRTPERKVGDYKEFEYPDELALAPFEVMNIRQEGELNLNYDKFVHPDKVEEAVKKQRVLDEAEISYARLVTPGRVEEVIAAIAEEPTGSSAARAFAVMAD